MDKMKWMARGALAAATAGVLVFAATADMGYDYPVGDPEISALLPANTVYYSKSGAEGWLGTYEVMAYDREEQGICRLIFGDIGGREPTLEKPELTQRVDYSYDEDGNLIASEHTNFETGAVTRNEWAYDADGREISHKSDTLEYTSTYGSDGTVTIEGYQMINGEKVPIHAVGAVDEHGNQTHYSETATDGIELWYAYEYDADGNMTKRTSLDGPDGKPTLVAEYRYEDGLLMEMHSTGVVDMQFLYAYDQYGHQAMMESTIGDNEPTRSFMTYYLPAAK